MILPSSTATDLLYFEDLEAGDRWISPTRAITADDVADFAMLTGDHDPLHLGGAGERESSDEDSGRRRTMAMPFGEPVAHGLLGLSVMAGLSSEHARVSTLALTGLTEWRFEAPIFFGDEVRVATTVVSAEPHGRRAGRVTWLRELINQHGRVVQRGHIVTLVATRSRRRAIGRSAPIEAGDTASQRGTLPA